MNFGALGGIGGAVAGYLQTPEGQETVRKFLSSPDGIQLLQGFYSTPEGQKALAAMLSGILPGLNLPAGTAEIVLGALKGGQ